MSGCRHVSVCLSLYRHMSVCLHVYVSVSAMCVSVCSHTCDASYVLRWEPCCLPMVFLHPVVLIHAIIIIASHWATRGCLLRRAYVTLYAAWSCGVL